jgi:hypothetical protein
MEFHLPRGDGCPIGPDIVVSFLDTGLSERDEVLLLQWAFRRIFSVSPSVL